MINKQLIQSIMFKDLFSSWPAIDVPVDAGDDEVAVTMSVTRLRIDARSDLVIVNLVGGFIIVLAKVMVDGMISDMIGVGVDVLAEFNIVVSLEVFVTTSCVADVWTGLWTITVIKIDVMFVMRVGAVVEVLLADIAIGFLTDIGVTMTDREFIDTRESLEDALRCC